MFNVPAPVKIIWQPVVPVVSAPEIVSVPVVMFIISFLVVVVADIVREPQVIVPAFTFKVQTFPEDGLGIINAPVIANEFVPLTVRTLLELTDANVSEAHCAFAIFTVTVMPEFIETASLEVGTAEPPHVDVLFQFPDTDAVLVASGASI